MPNRTFLFDFDGTLVDSMPTFVKVMLRILDEYGIEYDSEIIKIITPLGYLGTANYYRELGIRESVDALVQRMQDYIREEYEKRIPAKNGVREALGQLKERGAGLNILTASPHTVLDPCLKRLGIYNLFDFVWSCDDFGTTKADPEIYEMAAERIGKPVSEIIFVDDNINAVRTARSAGMISCGIFDESSSGLVGEMIAASDKYFMSFSELLDI